MLEISNDREKDLLQQIAELQSKIAVLVDELQIMKLKNVVVSTHLAHLFSTFSLTFLRGYSSTLAHPDLGEVENNKFALW